MSEWRSQPPTQWEQAWHGYVTRSEPVSAAGHFRAELEECHGGSHRSAEAALACSRRKARRLNAQGGAR